MATFHYKAFKTDGKAVSGLLEAETAGEAKSRLKKQGLYPRQILAEEADSRLCGFKPFRRRVSLPDLVLLTRRLATLLSSSVPMFEAITTLQEQERPGELKNILSRIGTRLAEGSSLAKALALEPKIFKESFVTMVAAGEASGALDSVLERLAEFLEDQDALRNRIITALAYPLLMLVVGTGVMLFLLGFVIPKIVIVFENYKTALPWITLLLIKMSTLIRQGWWALFLLLGAMALAWRKLGQKETLRLRLDRFLLHLFLVGPLVRRLVLSRFSKVLGLLLLSGVPIIKALEITADVVVNRAYRSFLLKVKEELIQGGSLSAALRDSPLFPPLLVHMIEVGEKSGQMEDMLIKAGASFGKEFDVSVGRAMGLLEPLLVLGMGLGVGTMVVAVLLPIFQLNQLIK
jgi:general secretion pathway protein F